MATADFLPVAPGVYANTVNRKTAQVRHHLLIGFRGTEPVIVPPAPKDSVVAYAVSPHLLFCPELNVEVMDVNDIARRLGIAQ